jgi:hypothetical protein
MSHKGSSAISGKNIKIGLAVPTKLILSVAFMRNNRLIAIGNNSGTWQLFSEDESPWKEGMPERSCDVEVPPGLVQPIRGFGGLWCAHLEIREQISWGTDHERGFEDGVDLIQGFDGGIIFRDSDGRNRGLAYVLFWKDMTFVKDRY